MFLPVHNTDNSHIRVSSGDTTGDLYLYDPLDRMEQYDLKPYASAFICILFKVEESLQLSPKRAVCINSNLHLNVP